MTYTAKTVLISSPVLPKEGVGISGQIVNAAA